MVAKKKVRPSALKLGARACWPGPLKGAPRLRGSLQAPSGVRKLIQWSLGPRLPGRRAAQKTSIRSSGEMAALNTGPDPLMGAGKGSASANRAPSQRARHTSLTLPPSRPRVK